jgi:hypothetical protein
MLELRLQPLSTIETSGLGVFCKKPISPTMNLIATTSVSDILTLVAFVTVATILGTALRSASGNVRRLNKTAAGSVAVQVDPDLAHRVVRSHYRSLRGMLIALMPAVTFVIAMTTCSLLRDQGFVIFWLPLILACCITGLVAWWSSRIQDRLILKPIRWSP